MLASTFPPNDIYKEKNEAMVAFARYLPARAVMAAFRGNYQKDPFIFPELRQKMKELFHAAQVFTFHNEVTFPL